MASGWLAAASSSSGTCKDKKKGSLTVSKTIKAEKDF